MVVVTSISVVVSTVSGGAEVETLSEGAEVEGISSVSGFSIGTKGTVLVPPGVRVGRLSVPLVAPRTGLRF